MAGGRLYVIRALALSAMSQLWGASPVGVATATGSFAVNQAQVSGKAAIYDGSVVETGKASSTVAVSNGSRIQLNPNSSLVVHGSDAVLEKGSGQLSGAGYELEARTLRIRTDTPGAEAQVRLTGERQVQVAALTGSVRVYSKTGVLVALLDPKMANTFDPYAASPEAFDTSGCLLYHPSDGQFGLAVDNQIYQLTGNNLAPNVGNRVHVVGTNGTAGAMQGVAGIVQASTVEMSAQGGCVAAAQRFAGWTATAPRSTGGNNNGGNHNGNGIDGHGHTGVIAGVAIGGGAAAGLGAYFATRSK